MSLRDNFTAQKQKLENLCEEHNLSASLKLDKKVITLTIRPVQGMYEQLSMLEQAEDGNGRISQDAYLQFIEDDGDYRSDSFGRFPIDEPLRDKFFKIFKKLVTFYCQFFRWTAIDNNLLTKGAIPFIEEDAGADPEDDAELEAAAEAEYDSAEIDLPDDEDDEE